MAESTASDSLHSSEPENEAVEIESENEAAIGPEIESENEAAIGSKQHHLPCKKTLTSWAKSKFQLWLAHREGSSQLEPSGTFTWLHKKSRFTAEQVIAWFEFKDKKYIEAAIDRDPETFDDRQFFACSTMFHKDPAFLSIFRKPLAKVVRKTGEKRKRYSNEFMFLPNSSDNIVAYPSSGLHQPRQESQPKLSQRPPQ
jgi:hypothetical protein